MAINGREKQIKITVIVVITQRRRSVRFLIANTSRSFILELITIFWTRIA